MAAVSLAAAPAAAPSAPQSVESRLEDLTVAKVQELAQRYLIQRTLLADTVTPDGRMRALKALGSGVWYPTEYRRACFALYPNLTPSELVHTSAIRFPKKISDGHAPEEYFTKVNRLIWKVKPEVSASDALDAALKGPTLTDCGGVCNLARAYALREVLGKERFDILFKGRLIIGYPRMDYLDYFFKQTTPNQIRKGTLVSFQNNRLYGSKHPFGLSQAFNMIAVGDGTFIGLGTAHQGLTAGQMKKYLAGEFNRPIDRRLGGIITEEEFQEFLAQSSSGTEDDLIKDNLQIKASEVPGLVPSSPMTFDMNRINAVLDLKPEQIDSRQISRIFPEWAVVTERCPEYAVKESRPENVVTERSPEDLDLKEPI